MASSTISVKLSNYIGNKTSMDISTTGEYKLSGSNVAVTKRYEGNNRYEVANSIADAGWKNPSTIVVVNKDAFDHAMTVSPLAYKLNAPILYTGAGKLTKTTENQIKKMKPDNILIIGNTKSISSTTEKALKKYGKIKRISGKDKFEISQKVAKEMGSYKQAIVAGGASFMNGTSMISYAARKGYPILLTKKNSIPTYKIPSKVIVVGSTKSISEKVEKQLKKTSQVTRISGENRYELSVNIIKKLKLNVDKVYLAKGSSSKYAIPMSLLAAKNNRTMIYVKKDSFSSSLKKLLKENGTHTYHIAGSSSVLSDTLKNALAKQVYLKKNQNYQLNISNGKISLKGIKTYNTVRVVPEKYSCLLYTSPSPRDS